jgi:tetratricopeptide (TPR) repeat protein
MGDLPGCCVFLQTVYNRSAEEFHRFSSVTESGPPCRSKEMKHNMNRIARVPVLAAATVFLLLTTTGCNQLKARDQLNKGVDAFKSAQYEEAIDHFQKAVSLDPSFPMTRMFLATAYSEQVVPDLQTPDNLKKADLAIQSYKLVLASNASQDTKNTAMKGIASLYFNIDKPDLAKVWQEKVIQADPNDADAPYTIGVIDWRQAYKTATKILGSGGLQPDNKGDLKMSKQLCTMFQQQNTDVVNEGMQMLEKAIKLNPSDDQAMSYLNLMYRLKADTDCADKTVAQDDISKADFWSQKAMGTRKQNELKKEKNTNQGITLQSNS